MTTSHTEERFLLFYYQECDILEKLEIEHQLENDLESNNDYYALSQELFALESVKMEAPKSAIAKILAYSK